MKLITLLPKEIKESSGQSSRLFCWHKWSGWRETKRHEICISNVLVGIYVIQERKCEKCGRVQLSEERVGF